ncbi:hypothetical protein [Lactobacillus acetotolerans]|uniref:hypothetical protein n=1 Tax=Lactobacillus acetotolerans TaxID=1600 RepID=UPI002FD9518D
MQAFQTENNLAVNLHQKMLKAHRKTAENMSIFTKVNQNGELIVTNKQALTNIFEAIDKEKADLFNAAKTLKDYE